VGPRAGLDAVKRKIPSHRRESNPKIPSVQPVADFSNNGLSYSASMFECETRFFTVSLSLTEGHRLRVFQNSDENPRKQRIKERKEQEDGDNYVSKSFTVLLFTRKMIWAGLVARMGDMRNINIKFLSETSRKETIWETIIILKLILLN
jgi:hypothetical protein